MDQQYRLYTRLTTGIAYVAEPAVLLYIGEPEGLRYIAPFVEQQFFKHVHTTHFSTITPGEVEGFINTHSPQLVCMLVDQHTLLTLIQPQDLVGASRVHQWVSCKDTVADALASMSKREARRRSEALSNGFSFDVSRSDDDFYHFYRTMHAPTMHHRYGDLARSVVEDVAYTHLFKQGQLFRIHQNEQWIAGSVCQIDRQRGKINARLIGVHNGDLQYRENGAQNFVYHAIIEWTCQEQALDIVDFQGCEPFLTKGTFQYKKRFGSSAVIPDNRFAELDLILRVQTLSPAVRRFLIDNPSMVRTTDGRLVARYFQDSRNAYRRDIPFKCEGMESSIILDLDEWYG